MAPTGTTFSANKAALHATAFLALPRTIRGSVGRADYPTTFFETLTNQCGTQSLGESVTFSGTNAVASCGPP